jgi:exodeoxyribonuclease V alpha subunit
VSPAGSLTDEAYEKWVGGYDVETGAAKGRLRTDAKALRFVEVVVNGPKTWSLAAALHPEIADALDAAQTRAAEQIRLQAQRGRPGLRINGSSSDPGSTRIRI